MYGWYLYLISFEFLQVPMGTEETVGPLRGRRSVRVSKHLPQNVFKM